MLAGIILLTLLKGPEAINPVGVYLYRHGWISYASDKQSIELAMIEFMNEKLQLDFDDSLTTYTFHASDMLPFALGCALTKQDIYYLKCTRTTSLQVKIECIPESEFLDLSQTLIR